MHKTLLNAGNYFIILLSFYYHFNQFFNFSFFLFLSHIETTIELSNLSKNVSFKFQSAVSKHGSRRLPSLFYEGITIGISNDNSHDIEVIFNSSTSSLFTFLSLLLLLFLFLLYSSSLFSFNIYYLI